MITTVTTAIKSYILGFIEEFAGEGDEMDGTNEERPDTIPGTPYFIYVITDGSDFAVKIGHAANPKKRLEAIQTGNPRELYYHCLYQTETKGHAVLLEHVVHLHLEPSALMGEWFAVTPEIATKQIVDRATAIQIPITLTTKATNRRRKKRPCPIHLRAPAEPLP